MAFCAKCGAALDPATAFCPSCGAAGAATPAPVVSEDKPMTSNVAGALAYLAGFITGVIFLVIEPYKRDSFVRFHSFQSIFLSVAYVVVFMVWGLISGALAVVSLGLVWSLLTLTWTLLRLFFFLLWLFLMYKAYNRERFMLPFIGPLAAKQAG